jgi:hypothetical protein
MTTEQPDPAVPAGVPQPPPQPRRSSLSLSRTPHPILASQRVCRPLSGACRR